MSTRVSSNFSRAANGKSARAVFKVKTLFDPHRTRGRKVRTYSVHNHDGGGVVWRWAGAGVAVGRVTGVCCRRLLHIKERWVHTACAQVGHLI